MTTMGNGFAAGDPAPNTELQGWKEIAQYLGKSVRAVQRWEVELGLPIHRMKTAGGQVIYAKKDEIDAWRARQELPARVPAPSRVPASAAGPTAPAPTRSWKRTGLIACALFVTVAVIIVAYSAIGEGGAVPLSFSLTTEALRANLGDTVAWEHTFTRPLLLERPVGMGTSSFPAQRIVEADVDGDGTTEILVAVSYAGGTAHGDELYCFSRTGQVRWRYAPDLRLQFRRQTFDAPWLITAVAVTERAGQPAEVDVALAHFMWWPSAVVRIDAAGRASLRFVQSGHIYALRPWEAQGRQYLAAGGINNEWAAASLVLLRADAPASRSPQTAGSSYECVECPSSLPDRYYVFDRTEVNRASDHPYNRVGTLQIAAGALVGHTEELPELYGASAIFTLAPTLEVASDVPGDGYWHAHRVLEGRRRLTHPAAACREARRQTRVFSQGNGWRTVESGFVSAVPGASR